VVSGAVPVPTATYRVQLTPGHGFAELAAHAAYLGRLGVSHAYVSPILQSAPGSPHGYDVVDHGHVDEELGGEDGFRRAAAALASHGVRLVVDVVPNHIAMTVPEHLNQVLWSVLRDGPGSRYAAWLDVDWTLGKPLVLPVLGRRIDECLDAGEITVDPGGGPGGSAVLRYFDHVLPVRPGTEVLPLEQLLAAQHFRLGYWRVADEELGYRRFFDVDTLVAIRVEDPEVFAASHALLVQLVGEGLIDGLRIDHPDGLADPRGYLRRLAEVTDDAWVVVEKILEPGEQLPSDWPCSGTTGYEAIREIGGLFVDPAAEHVLSAAFAEQSGVAEGWPAVCERSRRYVLTGPLVAEVDRLASVAYAVCQSEVRLRDHSLRGLTRGVLELLVAAPVYRAYVTPGEPADERAVQLLDDATALAIGRAPAHEADIVLLRDLALGRHGRSARKDEFCVRFQQTTGPAIAKGIEDTASYRWYPLSGLNEVGGQPDAFGARPADVHAWAADRLRRWPATLNAMSTHDTKRSEDVRARLAALSEVPGEWVRTVAGWQQAVGPLSDDHDGIDGATQWLLFQTAVGAWPIDAARLSAYLLKAVREAKQHTSWATPDERYESRVAAYVEAVLGDDTVVGGISRFVDRLHPAFVANSLGQRALQLLAPGIPDIYQGCETVDLSLVDPDNRQPVDYPALDAMLDRLVDARADGPPDPYADLPGAKLRLTAQGLRLRRELPELVGAGGSYLPLASTGAAGDHAFGFVRSGRLAVVATRLALRLAAGGGWRETRVDLPDGRWRDLLTDEVRTVSGGIAAADLLASWPVALLVKD
jgi:(1->4)-alpha-D-glucan 1-alpha-D-glucosylmutase